MTESEFPNGNVVTAPLPFARFRTLTETYGAAIEHWPEAERVAARALLERSQEARDAVADAALLDRILDTAEAPPPSDELVHELDRRFEAYRAPKWWLGKRWRMPSIAGISRPGLAFASVAAALLIIVLIQNRSAIEPPRAPILASSDPAIELGDGAFFEDDDSLDLEIALIDQSVLDPTTERAFNEPTGRLGLTVASAPLLEELPLD